MNPHGHNVRIRRGPNSWLVTRTDRDAADAGDAISSLGHFLNRILNPASPAGFRGVFQEIHATATGGRFVIGAARPIIVQAERDRPSVPDGLAVDGESNGSPRPRRVRALRPWFLSMAFEWHGSDVSIAWPQHFANVLGCEHSSDLDLDWLLLESHKVKP